MKFLNITLPLPLKDEFTYSVEDDVFNERIVGCRVLVEFNKRKMTGFITSVSKIDESLKVSPVIEILDDTPVFSNEMLVFCKWISDYYLCSLGEVLKLAIPSVLLVKNSKTAVFISDPPAAELTETENGILKFIKEFGPLLTSEIEKLFGSSSMSSLLKFKKKGYIDISGIAEQKKKEVLVKAFKIADLWNGADKTQNADGKISDLIKFFEDGRIMFQTDLKKHNISVSKLKKAVSSGFLTEMLVRKDHITSLLSEPIRPKDHLDLNDEQKKCSDEIIRFVDENMHRTFLLHGITGSGKTMVYISVISKVLALRKTAIMLVPEISLTPQTVRRFRSYLGDRISILHSRLSDYEKYENWEKIRNGEYSIVIGPRSAIFAPLKNIGIIIVDEEHDSSYKQTDSAPRYCARNSAVIRGFFSRAPVILGSATPSLESYYNAAAGKYKLLEIRSRFSSAVLPVMKIVKKENFNRLFEDNVLTLFEKELLKGRKIMVLQNRRGYSSHLVCRSCGNTATCPNCSVSLTYHLAINQLLCHYCGYYEKGKDLCPACGDANVFFKGAGTEQVEAELKRLFPSVPVLRMDYDSTRSKDGHSRILDEFEKPGAAILVGTQMIAKGLDFHAVSVVCIVNIDGELIFPDFRSDEKAFQLIEQVAGRAGRGDIKGKVIIQSFNENNPLLKYALEHDFHGFIKDEMKSRELTGYPPYSRIIKITLSSLILPEVKNKSAELYQALVLKNKVCVIYKPVDKMVLKVNNIFRLYILIKSSIINDRNGKKSRDLVSGVLASFKSSSKIKIDVDVDPSDLM